MKKINFRQVSVMLFYLLVSLKFLALPSLIYQDAQSDSWLVFVFMALIDIGLIWVSVYIIRSANEKNLYEFLKNRIGLVVTKIILVAFLLAFILDILDIVTGIYRLLVEDFYTDIKWYNYLIPLLCLISFMVYKGIRNIGRVCEIFVWLVIGALVFVILKSLTEFEVFFFLPSMTKGIMPVLKGLTKHISWFGSPIAIIFFIGDVDKTTYKKSMLWKYILIAILEVFVLISVFYGVFKETAGMHSFAMSDLSQVANESTAIDEISWLTVILWVLAQILSLSIVFYASVSCLRYIFNIKNSWLPILIINVLIVLYMNIDALTVSLEKYFFTPYALWTEWITKIGLMAVIFICNLVYQNKKKGKRNG